MSSEVIHRQLPPGPAPKMPTARGPTRNMREKFLAFLAANNPGGFANDKPSKTESEVLVGYALIVQAMTTIDIVHAKHVGRALRERLDNRRITLGRCYTFVAIMAGYTGWKELLEAADHKGVVLVRPFECEGDPLAALEEADQAEALVGNRVAIFTQKQDDKKEKKVRGVRILAQVKAGDLSELTADMAERKLEDIFEKLLRAQEAGQITRGGFYKCANYIAKRTRIHLGSARHIVAYLCGYDTYAVLEPQFDAGLQMLPIKPPYLLKLPIIHDPE